MLAPMSARLASSCSRKGTSAAATDTIWFGATSISSTISGVTMLEVAVEAGGDERLLELALLVEVGRRLRDVLALFLERAETRSTSSVTRPLSTLRYGVSTKPYSFTRAKVDSDAMRPMFGPSGVSIGQMRP